VDDRSRGNLVGQNVSCDYEVRSGARTHLERRQNGHAPESQAAARGPSAATRHQACARRFEAGVLTGTSSILSRTHAVRVDVSASQAQVGRASRMRYPTGVVGP